MFVLMMVVLVVVDIVDLEDGMEEEVVVEDVTK